MKPLVITEGKTDWKHLKAALLRLKQAGCFEQLAIDFLEYEDETQMGDAELLKMCKTYCKTPRDRPAVFIFDRDNPPLLEEILGANGEYKNWGNNVFSFALPVPAHRPDHPEICVELYYGDAQLTRRDLQGRRLFLSSEFHPKSGLHRSENVHCMLPNEIGRSTVTIINDQVFDRDSNNVALPKDDFADYVLNGTAPFDDLDVSEFAKVFEIVSDIVASESDDLDTAMQRAVDPPTHEFAPDHNALDRIDSQHWRLPKLHWIFDSSSNPPPIYYSQEMVRHTVWKIEDTLSSFGVPAKVVEINTGPVFSQYVLDLRGSGYYSGPVSHVRPQEIIDLANDLTIALAAAYPIQIQFPVPNRRYGSLAILIKNPQRETVYLGQVMVSREFRTGSSSSVALGKHVDGQPAVFDFVSFSHLLIAGRVNSGKSACVDSVLTCLLFKNTPVQLKLIMVDPAEAEFVYYADVPHLLHPVVTTTDTFLCMLQWVEDQAMDRSRKFAEKNVRSIGNFNAFVQGKAVLPLIVVVVDELPELMKSASVAVIQRLIRLMRISAGVGIHTILTTRRPGAKVVKELLQACPMTRIAFTMASQNDSKAVLGVRGAEELLGAGDALMMSPSTSAPSRIQVSFVSSDDVDRLITYWKREHSPNKASSSLDAPEDGIG